MRNSKRWLAAILAGAMIAPESTYGVGRTETDTIKLRRLYDEGYRIATEQTDALRAYLNK